MSRRNRRSSSSAPERIIEPQRGATYNRAGKFAVYEYGRYERSSVLAGQTKRSFIDGDFDSVAEALAKYPDATVSESSNYTPPSLDHLPDNELGDMENYERDCLELEQESWD